MTPSTDQQEKVEHIKAARTVLVGLYGSTFIDEPSRPRLSFEENKALGDLLASHAAQAEEITAQAETIKSLKEALGREEIALNIADQEQLAALIIRVVGLDDDPIRALQIKTPMALRAWDAAAQILNSALPPLPQQGEPVAWLKKWSDASGREVVCVELNDKTSAWMFDLEMTPLGPIAQRASGGAEPVDAARKRFSQGGTMVDNVHQIFQRGYAATNCEWTDLRALALAGVGANHEILSKVAWLEDEVERLSAPAEAQARVEALEVREIQMEDWSEGYAQPAESEWRIEINGYCADFPSKLAAENFRAQIVTLLSGSTPKPAGVEITEEMVEARERLTELADNLDSLPLNMSMHNAYGAVDAPRLAADIRAALTAALSGDAG